MIERRSSGAVPDRRLFGQDPRAGRWLWFAVAAAVGATLALVAQLIAVALAVAGVFPDGQDLGNVMPLLAAGLALLVLRVGLGVLAELAARRAATSLVGTLRDDLTAQLVRLGPTWRSGERSGELSGVLIGGLETVEEYVAAYLPARRLAMIVPVLVLATVLLLDPPSVLVLLFTGPMLLLLLAVIGGRTRAITQRRFLEMRLLSDFFLDILRGLATLKMFGRSREQVETLREVSRRYGDTTMEVLRTAFQTSLVLEWGSTIAIALVAVQVGLRLLDDGIAFDRALAVLLVTPEFFLPLRQLAVRFHVGTAGKAVIERAFELLDTPAPGTPVVRVGDGEPSPAPDPVTVSAAPRIRFEDVSFTYPGRAEPALRGVSMELAAGAVTAIVGASGAGKSTLSSLLLRFLEPDGGRIEVDGRDLVSVDPEDWRRVVAWVPQRPHLFHGTVADNIRIGRAGVAAHDIEAAARAANAAEFIERLPQGYGTPIGEGGARLSGGQRQRIAIARAFLRDAPVLVLDEATSHQDARSEAAIADALERLLAGRTVLVIAHRLHLAARADHIVVMHRGGVAEWGPPERLASAGGPYQRLLSAVASRRRDEADETVLLDEALGEESWATGAAGP